MRRPPPHPPAPSAALSSVASAAEMGVGRVRGGGCGRGGDEKQASPRRGGAWFAVRCAQLVPEGAVLGDPCDVQHRGPLTPGGGKGPWLWGQMDADRGCPAPHQPALPPSLSAGSSSRRPAVPPGLGENKFLLIP